MEMEHLDQEQEHEVYGGEIPDGDMDADVDMSRAEEEDNTKDLVDMKKSLKEIEEEAGGALREMQAKVEKEMSAVQDPSGASATQAENEEVDSRSIYVGNVTNAKWDRQTIERLNAYDEAHDCFERQLLHLKDAVERSRAESCLNAQALKKYIGENQKLKDENQFLMEECLLYKGDWQTAMEFGDEAQRRAEEAEKIVQELKLSADTTIKHLEATVTANRLDMETLNSKMEVLHCELRSKEDDLKNLRTSKEMLETEKSDLLMSNKENASKLEKALQAIRNLEDFANQLAAKLIELDKQSFTFSDKVVQLNSLYDSWFKMVQEEKDLASQCARKQYDQLHTMTSHVISENNETTSRVSQLNNNIIEVQKGQEFAMVQHAEECRLAEERIQILKSEAESNLARKSKLELLVSKLEEKINALSESARLSDTKMQDLILKFTALESESKYSTEKLQGDIDRQKQHLDALEKQVDKLQTTFEEKELLVLQSKQLELSRQTKFDQASADVEGKSLFTKLVGQGSPFRPGYKSPGRKWFLDRFGFG